MFDSGIFKSEDHLPLTVAFALLVVSVAAQWRSSKLHSAAIDDLQNQLEELEEVLRDQQCDEAEAAEILRQANEAILEKNVELNGLRKDLEEVQSSTHTGSTGTRRQDCAFLLRHARTCRAKPRRYCTPSIR